MIFAHSPWPEVSRTVASRARPIDCDLKPLTHATSHIFCPVKITLPESLKSDLSITFWGKILGATPVVMTVVATMLAGLASSEVTRAQYDRSFAAQLQSRAGDQWSFFRLRDCAAHFSATRST